MNGESTLRDSKRWKTLGLLPENTAVPASPPVTGSTTTGASRTRRGWTSSSAWSQPRTGWKSRRAILSKGGAGVEGRRDRGGYSWGFGRLSARREQSGPGVDNRRVRTGKRHYLHQLRLGERQRQDAPRLLRAEPRRARGAPPAVRRATGWGTLDTSGRQPRVDRGRGDPGSVDQPGRAVALLGIRGGVAKSPARQRSPRAERRLSEPGHPRSLLLRRGLDRRSTAHEYLRRTRLSEWSRGALWSRCQRDRDGRRARFGAPSTGWRTPPGRRRGQRRGAGRGQGGRAARTYAAAPAEGGTTRTPRRGGDPYQPDRPLTARTPAPRWTGRCYRASRFD